MKLIQLVARFSMVFGLSTGGQALAQSMDSEEDVPVARSTKGSKTQSRAYPGGRDDQDLEVQPSLPQPARNVDAAPGSGSGGETQESSVD